MQKHTWKISKIRLKIAQLLLKKEQKTQTSVKMLLEILV